MLWVSWEQLSATFLLNFSSISIKLTKLWPICCLPSLLSCGIWNFISRRLHTDYFLSVSLNSIQHSLRYFANRQREKHRDIKLHHRPPFMASIIRMYRFRTACFVCIHRLFCISPWQQSSNHIFHILRKGSSQKNASKISSSEFDP